MHIASNNRYLFPEKIKLMQRRNLDTSGIGRRSLNLAVSIIEDSGHFFQKIDGDSDIGIDGYIRIRKKVKVQKIVKNKIVPCEDFVDTGNLVGVQVKGVTSIPKKISNSYYIQLSDKDKFGVNFKTKENLDKHKIIWKNFVGPVILIFVDLSTKTCWWADLNDESIYPDTGYYVELNKADQLTFASFKKIKKLGRELFVKNDLITIKARNYQFPVLSLTNFKESAKEFYNNFRDKGEFNFPTKNPVLGEIEYSTSGWRHITRHNRRKMRIFNSILLLGVSSLICNRVSQFTKVKKGQIRESNRYIKKVEFLTLRANVTFNFRQSSIVQVVLRRVKTFDKIHTTLSIPDKVFFHSVYEPYRKE